MSWKEENLGPVWVPILNEQEDMAGLPRDLLARVAYQESHFREEIIEGTMKSPAGALGILQLMPKFFASVRVPTPFTVHDTMDQIAEGARELVRLYHHHHRDFGFVLASYNWGQGHMDDYIAGKLSVLPLETATYVQQILGDVQLPTSLKV